MKFDDILNDQRKLIYQNRKDILNTSDQSKIINEMINDFIDKIIIEAIPPKKYINEWNAEYLKDKCKEVFNIELPIQDWFEEEGVDELEITKIT